MRRMRDTEPLAKATPSANLTTQTHADGTQYPAGIPVNIFSHSLMDPLPHVCGTILVADPMSSAHQFLQVIMSIGGYIPPESPWDDTGCKPHHAFSLSQTLNNHDLANYRELLLRDLDATNHIWSRSLGPTGIRCLWDLSADDHALSRNRAYWAYSVRKPMKRMKIIVCTGRMVYMGG